MACMCGGCKDCLRAQGFGDGYGQSKSLMQTYILVGRTPQRVETLRWARWLEDAHAERVVRQENAVEGWVSTVFTGLSTALSDRERAPLLFETRVFGGRLDGEMERCATWAEAEAQHAAMIRRIEDES